MHWKLEKSQVFIDMCHSVEGWQPATLKLAVIVHKAGLHVERKQFYFKNPMYSQIKCNLILQQTVLIDYTWIYQTVEHIRRGSRCLFENFFMLWSMGQSILQKLMIFKIWQIIYVEEVRIIGIISFCSSILPYARNQTSCNWLKMNECEISALDGRLYEMSIVWSMQCF